MKKLLSVVLAILMLLPVFANGVLASAYSEPAVQHVCETTESSVAADENVISCDELGEKIYSTTNAAKTADEWDYIEQDGGIYITNCYLRIAEITVPDTIDSKSVIGISSLGYNSDIKTVNIPDSVTHISTSAFSGLYYVETVNIGANVATLEIDIFKWCRYLSAINISGNNSNFTSVDGIVYNKAGDTLIVYPLGKGSVYNIPDNVTNVDVMLTNPIYAGVSFTFSENSKVFKLIDGVTYTFDMQTVIGCDPEKTGEYTMPDSVTSIKTMAFYNTKLSKVNVSKNVAEITYYSFADCANLETINMPDTVTTIDEYAFYCSNLKNLTTLPKNLVNINYYAFANTQLQSMTISSNVKEIGEDAFRYSNLEKVIISEGVQKISAGAFANCRKLKNVAIGKDVTMIQHGAFNADYAMEKFIVDSENTAYSSDELGALFDKGKTEIISYPSANNSKTYTLPNSVTEIAYFAFGNCDNLSTIEIPMGVESINYEAFRSCNNLKNLAIPKSIKVIEWDAFSNCDKLSDVWYSGDQTDKSNINMSVYGNETFVSAEWHYNCCDIGQHTYADENDLTCETCNWKRQGATESGDINDDESINNKDLGLLMQYLNNWDVQINTDAADVNKDSAVNNKDYGLLMQYLNNWDVELQ